MEQHAILLHRISYFWPVAWPLLKAGYLSIGWSHYVNAQTDKALATRDLADFRKFVCQQDDPSRSRACLIRFVELKKGDWVVVPHPYMFSVYEVEENPITVHQLPLPENLTTVNGVKLEKNGDGFLVAQGKWVDLGFFVKVKPVLTGISRGEYADGALMSRLKIRLTNVYINDLRKNVAEAISRARNKQSINIYENIIENTAGTLLDTLIKSINHPDKLERLLKWYFCKMGASHVYIPPKNSATKEDYEDADVIAVFDALKVVFYVQAKLHKGITSDFAVKQISHYEEIHSSMEDDYNICSWVVSTGNFSKETIELAARQDVRLINGKQFAIMLLNAGIGTLDKAVL